MNVLTTLKNTARVVKHWTGNHAPELLLGAGIVSLGAAIYTAAKAGSKTDLILEDHKDDLEFVKRNENSDKKDLACVYLHTTGEFAKAYGPTVGFTALSVFCFCASYGIIKKRYVALTAAYNALQESFTLYRKRVIEKDGKEADLYYLTGEKPKTITVVDEVTGEKEKKKIYQTLPNGAIASPYAFKFGKYKENGERNYTWQNNRHICESIIMGQQDFYNDMLYSRCEFNADHKVVRRGSVMLNEIRDALGEDPTKAGAVTGWRFSNGEPGCNGYIDFNLIESVEIDPETGLEIPVFWIDPNVDGIIYDLLEKREKVPFLANFRDNDELLEG